MKDLLNLLLLGFIFSASAQNNSTTGFDSLLIRSQLSFTMSDGLKKLEIPFLHKIPHQLAIGPLDSSYQIRYWISPLDTWILNYNKKSEKKKEKSMNPNALCKSIMTLAVLDASITSNSIHNV